AFCGRCCAVTAYLWRQLPPPHGGCTAKATPIAKPMKPSKPSPPLWRYNMPSNKLMPLPLVLAPMLLSACASGVSNTTCPPVAAYSQSFQTALADELQTLPPAPHLDTALQDYAVLRQQIRTCQ